MSLLFDATVDPGGTVRSMRQHDTADLAVEVIEALTPIVRTGTHQGPLELELAEVESRLPWIDWQREGPDAGFALGTSTGVPLTYSALVSGRGGHGRELLELVATMPPTGEPEAGALRLVDVDLRPLLATRVLASAAVDTLLLEVCGQVETLIAAAFFAVLGVSAPEGQRWDR